MADEWIDVVNRLWESWEPGAIVADPETGMFADHTKIHPIDFEGRFYKCRRPLTPRPGRSAAPSSARPAARPPAGPLPPSTPKPSSPRRAAPPPQTATATTFTPARRCT